MQESNSEIFIYKNPERNINLDVRMDDDSVWLSIPQMAELFGIEERSIIDLIKDGYTDNGAEDELILDSKDQRTFVDSITNAETVCYNLINIRFVGFFINYNIFFSFFTWAAKLLEEHILKNLIDNPDDPPVLNPGIKYLKLHYRLMANAIDISFDLSNQPPERINNEIAEGVWFNNDDEILEYLKKKKSGEIPFDATQN